MLRNQHAYISANPARQAAHAIQAAKHARTEADRLRSLTPAEAVERIEQTRAEQALRDAQRAERERAVSHDYEQQHRSTPRQDGLVRGL